MTTRHNLKNISRFIKDYASVISLAVSIVALGIGVFNTYQIKNNTQIATAGGTTGESPEKIIGELPKNTPVMGNPNAKLTVVEFGDFQCPYCGQFHKDVLPALKQEYIDTGKVKFAYIDFAFLGQESRDAAEAAKCAGEQNKFWEYYDELYNNQKGENLGAFNADNLKKFASDINLNAEQFNSCVLANKYNKQIADELSLGKKFGINGTPGFLIGKQSIKGAPPVAAFEQVINSQLK